MAGKSGFRLSEAIFFCVGGVVLVGVLSGDWALAAPVALAVVVSLGVAKRM
jgi:hypothetical protein